MKLNKSKTNKIKATLLIAIFILSTLVVAIPVSAVEILEVQGFPTTLTEDGGHYLGDFSPDGSMIVYTGTGGIWVMDNDGSNPQLIYYDSGTRPDWGPSTEEYPDGLIALAGEGITIITPDGTDVKTIGTSHLNHISATITRTHSLEWSPDGSKIAFADHGGGVDGIWTVDYATGLGLTQITDYSATAYSPTWSPDGTEIACAWGLSTTQQVGVFKSDGTKLTPERVIGTGGDYPDWDSNGKIAYHVQSTSALYVMNGDGTEDTRVFDGPAAMVAWSPDSKSLVYINGFADKNIVTRGYPFATIQSAIDAASAGDTISVAAGTYYEGITEIDKELTIVGDPLDKPVIKPTTDTGSTIWDIGSNGRGWFQITGGPVEFENLVFDGDGKAIYIAIYYARVSDGSQGGAVKNCDFRNIQYNQYQGRGVSIYGGYVEVLDSTFTNIQRIGVFTGIEGTESLIKGNTYTGKGDGDWLDYAFETGEGAHATIEDNTITDCSGEDSGWVSAGIYVHEAFGDGTSATIMRNTISGSNYGIIVGYGTHITSTVVAHYNDLAGNDIGMWSIGSQVPLVDARFNWWGTIIETEIDAMVTGDVDYSPWLSASYPDGVPMSGSASMTVTGAYPLVSITVDADIVFEELTLGGWDQQNPVTVTHTGSEQIKELVTWNIIDDTPVTEEIDFYATYLDYYDSTEYVVGTEIVDVLIEYDGTATVYLTLVDVPIEVEPGVYSGTIVFWAEYDSPMPELT